MNKILLFYKYIAIKYPKHIMKWQQKICSELGFKGRILISHEGINGTLGGSIEHTEHYKKIMSDHPLFGSIDFKESDGGPECFPRMAIKVRDEAVALGLFDSDGVLSNGGIHLSPEEAHALLQENPHDLLILDARNDYESAIGRFTNALLPPIQNFRELPAYIDDNVAQFKDKQVLMYCTGGIRCERATAYLNEKKIAKKVYQISGGIHRYVEKYPDGYFRGKNYVFDGRIAVHVTNDILSTCTHCNTPCDDYNNCINACCNKHFICCAACIEKLNKACSNECATLITEKKVNSRPAFNTISAETHSP